MKDRWTAFWIAGISVLALAGAACLLLDRPQRALTVSVLDAPCVTELTVSETTVTSGTYQKPAETVTSPAETVPLPAETERPERNLNLADAADLKRVAGIGDVLAAEIISERTQRGGFTARMQLCEISGIGTELMQRIMEEFEIPGEVFPAEDAPDGDGLPAAEPEDSVYYIVYDANTVTLEELLTIPDMDEEKADAILDLRRELTCFDGIYELSLAKGISGEYFEHVLKQHLYVAGDPHSDARQTE